MLLNSTFGMGGLFDLASMMGIERHNQDFGITFGKWGIPQGPYFFVPLFGPTTVRDGTGTVIRAYLGPTTYIFTNVPVRNVIWGVGALDLARQRAERGIDGRPGGARPLPVHSQRIPARRANTRSTTASRRRKTKTRTVIRTRAFAATSGTRCRRRCLLLHAVNNEGTDDPYSHAGWMLCWGWSC